MKQQIKKLKKKEALGWVETGCMPKVFYTASWKQLFQHRNGKEEHGTVRRRNNPRIMIVGGKPKND